MADSEAVRSRRKRLHARGDHSMCRQCAAMRGDRAARALRAAPVAEASPGERLDALARRLEAAHMAEPANAMVARELRMTLVELGKAEKPADDVMGELRALAAGVS